MRKITIKAKTPFLQIDVAELFEFRWVFLMLIIRDIKLRYKQTLLGVAWVILQPLISALLFAVVFGKLMKVPSGNVPYVVFAFCGLVPWLLFSQSLQRASTCLVNDTRLITKVYFPRIFVPMSATFGVIIDFLISLGLMFGLMALYGIPLTTKLAFLPVASLILLLFSSGVNLLLSASNVYYRDLKHVLPSVIQLWMYASPIVYAGSMIPERYQLIYSLNPLAGVIDAFRWSLLGQGPFPTYSFSVSVFSSVLMLGVGVFVFRKIEHYFADII